MPPPPNTIRSRGDPREHNADVIREVLTSIRTCSTIRFAALPVFLAALAVLAEAYYTKPALPKLWLVIAALVLSLVAGVVEAVLSRNLIVWWAALAPLLRTTPPWEHVAAHRDPRALTLVRWALLAPYLLSFAFWLDHLLYAVTCWLGVASSSTRNLIAAVLAAMVAVGLAGLCHTFWRSAGAQRNR